ncbi:MAG: TonB-dependent receptor [Nitrospirae bacterium]|nr:TonB-dependent receptor [Nitrospirota bacterium]
MKKLLNLICAFIFLIQGISVYAEEIGETIFTLGEVVVTAEKDEGDERKEIDAKVLKTHKVVDLAEILSDEMITATMIRKGSYGNEIALRGFSQANLRFFADDTIVEGACGSRKDPSFSHISLLTVDRIEVREGPFDVTEVGALGGSVNVITKRPQEGFHGEILPKAGSYGYWSTGGYLTGGNKKVQGLIGYNYSESNQYEDGAGNKISSFNPTYSQAGKDAKAFKKHDIWGKLQFKPKDNQTLFLSHTYGKANDILTPRVEMDTESEITNLSRAEYIITDLGIFSDKLTLSLYHNRIEHYPSHKYRTVSPKRENDVVTTIVGGKIENERSVRFAKFTYGFNFYRRNWDGYMMNSETGAVLKPDLFPDADELDLGLYLKADKDINNWSLNAGIRGDYFETEANDLVNGKLRYSQNLTDTNKNKEMFLTGYFTAKYYLTEGCSIFWGIGHSVRTPTLVERYLQASSSFYGNPDLDATKNTEIDFGFQAALEKLNLKAKAFYSDLKDYIYQQAPPQTWTNIDAHIYGFDAEAIVDIASNFTIQGGLAYQRGKKDSQPLNNTDKNLAQIPPLKTKLALNYDNSKVFGTLEWIHSEDADEIDIDAGEQKLKGWDVLNLRAGYKYKQLTFNIGVDNIFDQCYAVANSYEWDVVAGAGANPSIVNEPGRFIYGSISYSF